NRISTAEWSRLLHDRGGAARLFDRARSGAYPPGSSIKVATAAAAMEAGLDPVFTCHHTVDRLQWRHRGKTYVRLRLSDDEGDPPHGTIGMAAGLRHSCNIYFAN